MKLCYLMALLPLISYASPSVAAEQQPDAVVRNLYREIVARRPLGIPKGADKKAIWPFLSMGFIRTIETAQACEDDYIRQHLNDTSKPEFGWLENGLFSGENEQAIPAEAVVERMEPQKHGSFKVYVRLTYKETYKTSRRPPDPEHTFSWNIAVKVISEGGRFVVDDVLRLKEDSTKVESRLSRSFKGCRGSRWIGRRRSPDMAGGGVLDIPIGRATPMRVFEGQGIGFARNHNQVDVIRHQAIPDQGELMQGNRDRRDVLLLLLFRLRPPPEPFTSTPATRMWCSRWPILW
ncbi:MAG: hypothetical protein LAP21_15420 [Acidobacteriia bacterium]|nr:hypothetical protein [Terriglobia bacterium]